MPAHTLRDGNLRQMPRAVGPLANGLWKMEVRGRPQPCSFRPLPHVRAPTRAGCKQQNRKSATPYIVTGRIGGRSGNYLPSQGQGIHRVRSWSLRVQAPGTAPSLPLRLVASVMSVVSVIFYCSYFDVILTRRRRLTTTDTTDTPDFLRARLLPTFYGSSVIPAALGNDRCPVSCGN